jgi:hypothetical protein
MEQGEWYYTRGGGEELGPVTVDELRSMLVNGTLRDDDLAWREGLAEWTALREIPEVTGGPQAVPPSNSIPAAPDGPSGIGGWLILPAIGLVLAVYARASSLVALAHPTMKVFTENWLGTGRVKYAAVILGRDVVNMFLLGFTIYVVALFFRKKRALPKACVILLWAGAVCALGNYALHAISGELPRDIMLRAGFSIGAALAIAIAVIWTAYFMKSARVKNTFVVP